MPDYSNEITKKTEKRFGPFVFGNATNMNNYGNIQRGPYRF